MAVTGQISVARVGRSVQIFERTSDINQVFDPNTTPDLQTGDHVTLYPGDYRNDLENDPITIPENVFLTILPGAIVGVQTITGPIQQRYRYIDGAISNIADMNLADQFTTQIERQSSRIRVYSEETKISGSEVPFRGFSSLDDAAEEASRGDTVLVFPGNYEPSKNLYKRGVDWHFMEGAIVKFAKENFEDKYPHALYDDKRLTDGTLDATGSTECNVYGRGEFIIGTENLLPNKTSTNFWNEWNLYGLLALNADSFMDFNAKKVTMVDNADAAIKVSSAQDININIDKVEFTQELAENIDINKTGSIPSFCIFNATDTDFNEFGTFSLDVREFIVRERPEGEDIEVYFLSSVKKGEYNPSRQPFQGDIHVELEETTIEHPQVSTNTILCSGGLSPKKFIISDSVISENGSGIKVIGSKVTESGTELPQTKFVIKDSIISTKGSLNKPPLILEGVPSGFDINLKSTDLITGEENVDFESPRSNKFSVKNSTSNNNYEIKFYGGCYADSPVQNFDEILHPELNDVQWTQEAVLLG